MTGLPEAGRGEIVIIIFGNSRKEVPNSAVR